MGRPAIEQTISDLSAYGQLNPAQWAIVAALAVAFGLFVYWLNIRA